MAVSRKPDAERLLVICNMSGDARKYTVPAGFENAEILIGNYKGVSDVLCPWEARMMYEGGTR